GEEQRRAGREDRADPARAVARGRDARRGARAARAEGRGPDADLTVSERRDLAVATTRSAAFPHYARRYAPDGVLGGGRYWRPYPLCIARAAGARLWDIDGNEYVDYHGSYGPSVLGQNHEEVRDAVVEVLESRGVLFALPHELEIELCRRIT